MISELEAFLARHIGRRVMLEPALERRRTHAHDRGPTIAKVRKPSRVIVLFAEPGQSKALEKRVLLFRDKIEDVIGRFAVVALSADKSQSLLYRRTGSVV